MHKGYPDAASIASFEQTSRNKAYTHPRSPALMSGTTMTGRRPKDSASKAGSIKTDQKLLQMKARLPGRRLRTASDEPATTFLLTDIAEPCGGRSKLKGIIKAKRRSNKRTSPESFAKGGSRPSDRETAGRSGSRKLGHGRGEQGHQTSTPVLAGTCMTLM